MTKEQKVKELIQLIKRPQVDIILTSLVSKIEDSGCRIFIDYSNNTGSDKFSSHIPSDGENPCRVRIAHKSDNPFYDIFHEWGHHLSGKRKPEDSDLDRELIAWDYGIKEFLKCPELESEWVEFIMYKNKCLKSYVDYLVKNNLKKFDRAIFELNSCMKHINETSTLEQYQAAVSTIGEIVERISNKK